jgi:hypothetical protein
VGKSATAEQLRAGLPGFDSRQGKETTVFRPALEFTQPPRQWVPGALSLGVNGRVVNLTTHLHLVPKSRIRRAIPLLPNTSSWRSA